MLNLITDGMQAYNQVGLFVGALFLLAAGGILLGYSLYQRRFGYPVTGTIIGVLCKDDMFRPVYRFTLPDGQSHVAQSQVSSSWTRGKETGRIVPLVISPTNPARVREAKSWLLDITGGVLLALGMWLIYVVVTAYPITLMTWLMVLALIVFIAERGYRALASKGHKLSLAHVKQYARAEWDRKLREDEGAIDLADVKPIEQILADPERRRADVRQSRVAAVFLTAFAVFLVGFGIQESRKLSRLEALGLRAPGEVVRLQRDYSSDDSGRTVYFAIVRFKTADNARVEFKDRVGSNPPSYRRGDKVTVLYLADNPQRDAMIDHGVWGNWVIPALLFLAAAFVLWLLVMMVRGVVLRRPAIPQPAV